MKIENVVVTVIDDKGKEHKVTIESSCGSYEQYGAELKAMRFTSALAQALVPFFSASNNSTND